MPYRYREEIATADVAFEAWGETLEEMFVAAADATMHVMVEDLSTIAAVERRAIEVEEEAIDLLLFKFLQEIVFHKDADQLLLRFPAIAIVGGGGERYRLNAEGCGERIDPGRHPLNADVKAVTLHLLSVEKTAERGWVAAVILDI